MPPSLRDQLEVAAHENKRSLNAEILARLEISLTEPGQAWLIDHGDGGKTITSPRSSLRGVDKERLIKTAEAETPITRADLYGAIDMAIDHALGKLGIGPKVKEPNTGPKPRKLRPKE
jgi:hypothetical protein